MQYRLCALALAALCSTSLAAPSAHGAHRRVHENAEEKREAINWDDPSLYTGVNWATVNYGGQKATSVAAAPAAATTAAAAAPAGNGKAAGSAKASASTGSSSSTGSSNTGNTLETAFGGVTAPVGSGDSYIGNVGSPFGSNVILIDSSDASKFNYVVKFVSTASSARDMIIWNKAGPAMIPNTGMFKSDNAIAKKFSLAPGSTQYVAFDKDSSGAFCDWTSGQTNAIGAYDCAFGEFDFGSSANGGWSGYDVSMIQNPSTACGLSLQSSNGALSSCTENMYTVANQAVGGIGGNLAPGNVLLTATVS